MKTIDHHNTSTLSSIMRIPFLVKSLFGLLLISGLVACSSKTSNSDPVAELAALKINVQTLKPKLPRLKKNWNQKA
jgi:hypothetical protein